jgi:hypothetical protein
MRGAGVMHNAGLYMSAMRKMCAFIGEIYVRDIRVLRQLAAAPRDCIVRDDSEL